MERMQEGGNQRKRGGQERKQEKKTEGSERWKGNREKERKVGRKLEKEENE